MSKRKKIIYWIATLWLALGMVSTGIVQLLRLKSGAGGADSMAHLGYPDYLLPLLGAWKILGVTALLIPRFPLLKEWAYAGFFFTLTGAIVSHAVSGDAISEFFVRPAGKNTIEALLLARVYLRNTRDRVVPTIIKRHYCGRIIDELLDYGEL